MSIFKSTILSAALIVSGMSLVCAENTPSGNVKTVINKEINLVPEINRSKNLLRNCGYGLTLKLNSGEKYFISVKVKLNKASTTPNPQLRLVARYKTANGKFNYKWGDLQTLRNDDYITFTMIYHMPANIKNEVMIIISPKGFSKEDEASFKDFTISEIPDEFDL